MSGPSFSFVVPGAPVAKARARVSIRKGKVRAHTPLKTANYETRVAMFARVARPANWPMRCEYRVSFTAYPEDDRADMDNYLKSAMDAAQGILWANDKSVRRIGESAVVPGDANPRMVIAVEALPVKCSRAACTVTTLYPDDDGRCDACPVQHRKRRT